MKINRIVQIVPRIATASSGPSISVPSLCQALADTGQLVRLYTLTPRPERCEFHNCSFFSTSRIPLAYRLGVSKQMNRALHQAAYESDILHTNSLWMMPNIYPKAAIRNTTCSLVVSPRGTLSAWAVNRARLRKWIVWRLGQRQTLETAHCIHVTSQDELRDVRMLGLRNPVAVIPNGVACPDLLPRNRISETENKLERTVLFLARIHPKKGVEILLNAWKILQSQLNDFYQWKLRIVGPINHQYAESMRRKASTERLQNVVFEGEFTGAAKSQAFRNADLYVLPSHSENFGISVAEALAHGVPAIVFQGAPWSGLNQRRAGWWIEPGLDSLVETLKIAMSLTDEERQDLGLAGHLWMKEEFDWRIIGQQMAEVYTWLRTGTNRPVCVDENAG